VLEDLYRDLILKHYQAPANRRYLEKPDVQGSAQNPLCGDEITISAQLEADRIADAAFQARGCSISQASADMMADAVRGKSLADVRELIRHFEQLMREDVPGDPEVLGDLMALVSVKKYPVRVKCALLSWVTLAEAIDG
jgi:nitrogen fixation protein NifU and related proteins